MADSERDMASWSRFERVELLVEEIYDHKGRLESDSRLMMSGKACRD